METLALEKLGSLGKKLDRKALRLKEAYPISRTDLLAPPKNIELSPFIYKYLNFLKIDLKKASHRCTYSLVFDGWSIIFDLEDMAYLYISNKVTKFLFCPRVLLSSIDTTTVGVYLDEFIEDTKTLILQKRDYGKTWWLVENETEEGG